MMHPVLNNTGRIYGYTHTAAEALQQIRFLQGDFTPPTEILPVLMPNADIQVLNATNHSLSDIYFIELSSTKELRIDDRHGALGGPARGDRFPVAERR